MTRELALQSIEAILDILKDLEDDDNIGIAGYFSLMENWASVTKDEYIRRVKQLTTDYGDL